MVAISTLPKPNQQTLGSTSGRACGAILLGTSVCNFIPFYLNGRVERAHQAALARYPEATALVDISVRHRWYWIGLGTLQCTEIRGTAIK